MEIIKVVSFAILAAMVLVVLRQYKPEIALTASLAAGAIILIFTISKVSQVINILQTLAEQAKVNPIYFKIVLKVVGVAYLAGFGAQVCRDAGEGAIAMKIEMAGKIIVLLLAIPILSAILQVVLNFL